MVNMNAIKIFLLLLLPTMLVLNSCKSKKMTAVEPVPPVQEIVYEPVREPVREPETQVDVPVRTERFTFEDREQEVTHDFFVIVGSYREPDNAARARTILINQGFTPAILLSETGFNRVSVNSYSVESEARMRVQQIRRNFPEYHDTWLLIRQR